ncbi:hypothetical protein F2Q70_00000282 [Brassica cretica]|uniref:Uncharacterized protein n=2 Tax=Brassica TaxID=3705 RepID=A0A8S9IQD5_BRACR|nr:hypothetical protein F2Q70_00000282 [Brassica cretica]
MCVVVFLAKSKELMKIDWIKQETPTSSQPVASGFQMEDSSPRIISREGCFASAGWAAAMHLYNDPTVDVSERPVMYHGGDVLNEAKPLQIQASGKQDTTSTKVAK